jgi:hypothetical protein
MRPVILTTLLAAMLCMSSYAVAQNIDGHWFGVGIIQTPKQNNSYLTEMIVRQKGKQVWGEFLYYFKDSLVKTPIKGSYDRKTGRLKIIPLPIIYYKSPSARNSIECMMSGYFRLVASKTESVLQGSLLSDAEHKYTVPSINFRLKKSNDTTYLAMSDDDLGTDPEKPTMVPAPLKFMYNELNKRSIDSMKAANKMVAFLKPTGPAPVNFENTKTIELYQKREKNVAREILVTNSTLRVELFDNGEIDNDSISVFFNDTLILPGSMLNLKPIKLTIQLDSTLAYNELSMFALNLGNIPPNTALLVLYDGSKRYEIFLSSDLSRSATLRLRRKKPK